MVFERVRNKLLVGSLLLLSLFRFCCGGFGGRTNPFAELDNFCDEFSIAEVEKEEINFPDDDKEDEEEDEGG